MVHILATWNAYRAYSFFPGEAPGGGALLDSFLLSIWYRVIRCRFGLDGAGVERSYRLPLSHEEMALVVLSLANSQPFTPVQIQKALFLATDKVPRAFREGSNYHFEPYDYGPFDWQVYADAENLQRRGLAQINQEAGSRWRTYAASSTGVAEGRRLAAQLTQNQREILQRIVNLVRRLTFDQLVSAIYRAYPHMRERSVFRN